MAASGASQGRNAAAFVVPAVALSSRKSMPWLGLGMATATLGQAEGHAGVMEAILRALDAGYLRHRRIVQHGSPLGDTVFEAMRAGMIASQDDVYVMSKLWLTDTHSGRVLPALHETLQTMQMEYVDLYLIHYPVSMRPPDEAQGAGPVMLVKKDMVALDMKGVWEEMEECHRRGLARSFGVSNFTYKKLEYLLSFAKIPPAVNHVTLDSSTA